VCTSIERTFGYSKIAKKKTTPTLGGLFRSFFEESVRLGHRPGFATKINPVGKFRVW
jgi:hypothetical protein